MYGKTDKFIVNFFASIDTKTICFYLESFIFSFEGVIWTAS